MVLKKFKEYLFGKKPAIELFYEDVKKELTDLDAGVPEDDSITAAKLKANSVETAKIKDDAVTSDKIALFISSEQTGTGAAQAIPHGLGVSPNVVAVIPTKIGSDGAEITSTKGSTNINVTATTGAKYIVLAIA